MLSIENNILPTREVRSSSPLLASMWRERKSVFVDVLGWDVPIVDDAFEIDQFDTEHAVYMVIADEARTKHLASVRLLPSTRPHILGDIFPQLCAGSVPRAPGTWEITRLCMSPALSGVRQAMLVRRELALGLAEYALDNGISDYTQVHLAAHLPQLLAVGWDCDPLGFPVDIAGQRLMASRIAITSATLTRIRAATGVRQPVLQTPPLAMAA